MTEQSKPRKSGHPPHEPTKATRDTVQMHTMVGTTQADIARIIGIDEKTLRKYYRNELDLAKARANATIGGALFNKAKAGDTTAMIFWMKTQAGWKAAKDDEPDQQQQAIQTVRIEVVGADPHQGD
jgi:DNA-binding XRE family transcriptional regulator